MNETKIKALSKEAGQAAADLYSSRKSNCAGSALSALNKAFACGLSQDLINPITASLGGGLSRGATCGALLGSEIGLSLAANKAGAPISNDDLRKAGGRLYDDFQAAFGSVNCRDLKKGDPNIKDSHVPACAQLVAQTVEMAIKQLQELKPDLENFK